MTNPHQSILVVDESLVDQWLVSEALADEVPQAEILRISSSREAETVLRLLETRDRPEIILLDYLTPAALRETVVDLLEHDERWQGKLAIVVHDQDQHQKLDSWARSCALTILAKPVSFEEYLMLAVRLRESCRLPCSAPMTG